MGRLDEGRAEPRESWCRSITRLYGIAERIFLQGLRFASMEE
jgi:hypothetical protein